MSTMLHLRNNENAGSVFLAVYMISQYWLNRLWSVQLEEVTVPNEVLKGIFFFSSKFMNPLIQWLISLILIESL